MKDRILKVMEREALTPARFSEAIGIQRSAMSHIVSGRNNPSLDVLMKILSTYTHISTDWLLKGEGPMYKTENNNYQPSLFTENDEIRPEIRVVPEKSLQSIVELPKSDPKPTEIEQVIYEERSSKNVSKIMIFYSDNTFETFTPEKNKTE